MQNRTYQDLAENIQQHRWLVFHILGEGNFPPFSYTVGLYATFGYPEVVLSGLNQELAHALLNDMGEDAARGIQRQPDVLYEDVLGALAASLRRSVQNTMTLISGERSSSIKARTFPCCNVCGRMPSSASLVRQDTRTPRLPRSYYIRIEVCLICNDYEQESLVASTPLA
ncbi:DUF4262 domain-containing protein [Hymenobacter volaticus]|uniref:DUF4262 domain-containing protein n=1 Tax=Hymenobacter volaticus TaxID=2932254 RepID=A0ABY4GEA4_9BACT|nr:DUF4262 domain-containing protein [Hymenobacter volaticus]UOQ69183.1 DUF4262 domain-containing protein [Hymenobacter volaticus]